MNEMLTYPNRDDAAQGVNLVVRLSWEDVGNIKRVKAAHCLSMDGDAMRLALHRAAADADLGGIGWAAVESERFRGLQRVLDHS